MKKASVFLLAASLATSVACAADITGTVKIEGTPPAEKPYTPIMNDPICSKLHKTVPMTEFYVVGPDKGLADVIVMLKNVTGKSTGASAPAVELDQKGCLYTPQIVAIQTGQKLDVKNSDPTLHNVHASPTVSANASANPGKLNQAQMQGAPDIIMTFPAAENFMKFQCDVHPWMFAWVTVVDSPYYAVTGKDGKFKISNVPPGKYTITALHRKLAPEGEDQQIEVKEGQPATVNFTLKVK
jgi:plastocyanin